MSALDHLVLILALRCLAAFFLCGVEGVEVGTFVVVESFGVLMNDVCGDFIEKSTIVGDDEEGRGVGL